MVIVLVGTALMCDTIAINEAGQLDGLNVGTADDKSLQEVLASSVDSVLDLRIHDETVENGFLQEVLAFTTKQSRNKFPFLR